MSEFNLLKTELLKSAKETRKEVLKQLSNQRQQLKGRRVLKKLKRISLVENTTHKFS